MSTARRQLADGQAEAARGTLAGLAPNQQRIDEVAMLRSMAEFRSTVRTVEPMAVGSYEPRARALVTRTLAQLAAWSSAHPDDVLVWQTLGHLHMITGDFGASAAAFTQATQRRPNDPTLWNDLAMTQVAARQLADAEQSLLRATTLAPQDAEPFDNLGAVRLARGNAAGAVEALQTAVSLRPDEARFLADLGAAQLSNGNAEEATRHLGRAVARAPLDPVVAANYGMALWAARRGPEARQQLDAASLRFPRAVSVWANLATVRFHLGDRAGAERALREAEALGPGDPRLAAQRAAFEAAGPGPNR